MRHLRLCNIGLYCYNFRIRTILQVVYQVDLYYGHRCLYLITMSWSSFWHSDVLRQRISFKVPYIKMLKWVFIKYHICKDGWLFVVFRDFGSPIGPRFSRPFPADRVLQGEPSHFADERRAALAVQRLVYFAQLYKLECSFVIPSDNRSLKPVSTACGKKIIKTVHCKLSLNIC